LPEGPGRSVTVVRLFSATQAGRKFSPVLGGYSDHKALQPDLFTDNSLYYMQSGTEMSKGFKVCQMF